MKGYNRGSEKKTSFLKVAQKMMTYHVYISRYSQIDWRPPVACVLIVTCHRRIQLEALDNL